MPRNILKILVVIGSLAIWPIDLVMAQDAAEQVRGRRHDGGEAGNPRRRQPFARRHHDQSRARPGRALPEIPGDRRLDPTGRRKGRPAGRRRIRRLSARRPGRRCASGDVRDQRRARRRLGVAAIGRDRPLAPADERSRALLGADADRQRGNLAGFHRSRLHRSAGNRLQPGARDGRRRQKGPLVGRRRHRRFERRHPALARRQWPARLAQVHRRRELRRFPRSAAGQEARLRAGNRRRRPDLDFAGARFPQFRPRAERSLSLPDAAAVLRGGLPRKERAGLAGGPGRRRAICRPANICRTGCAARATPPRWRAWSNASPS